MVSLDVTDGRHWRTPTRPTSTPIWPMARPANAHIGTSPTMGLHVHCGRIAVLLQAEGW